MSNDNVVCIRFVAVEKQIWGKGFVVSPFRALQCYKTQYGWLLFCRSYPDLCNLCRYNVSNYKNQHIDNFFSLCATEHIKHRNIEYYTGKLCISSRYLYKITKEVCKVTPKQIIDYYVSGTAKKKLLTTILTNLQIADELNFPDQATFGQFFKRNVGMSPSKFRNKYK